MNFSLRGIGVVAVGLTLGCVLMGQKPAVSGIDGAKLLAVLAKDMAALENVLGKSQTIEGGPPEMPGQPASRTIRLVNGGTAIVGYQSSAGKTKDYRSAKIVYVRFTSPDLLSKEQWLKKLGLAGMGVRWKAVAGGGGMESSQSVKGLPKGWYAVATGAKAREFILTSRLR